MKYEIIDGKLFEVKEVDADQFKIEIEQALKVVEEQEKKVEQLEAQKKNVCASFDNQIVQYQNAIKGIEERKVNACKPYDDEITNAKVKVDAVKVRLQEKKEALELLFPEASSKLGF